jgi:hypothetical protein
VLRSRLVLTYAALAFSAFAAEPPRPSPPLEILRPGAPALTLSQYRGKIVVLALIHTTCSHCQQFTVVMNILAHEYTPRGVQFLECAFNDDAVATMPEFQQRFHPSFPVGYTSTAAVNTYLRRTLMDPRPLYVPHLVVLDRAGRIYADYPGEDPFMRTAENGLRTLLDNMLKPAAPSKK